MMKLINHIKQHRARMNFTQQDLADHTGVSRQTIYAIEKKGYIPSTLLAFKIADALQMRVDNLFELEEESKQDKNKEISQAFAKESFIEKLRKSRFD